MPGTAEKLLRALFWAQNLVNETDDLQILQKLLVSALQELDSLDEHKPAQASFRLDQRWDEAEKKAA
jgi:hypothetical protein